MSPPSSAYLHYIHVPPLPCMSPPSSAYLHYILHAVSGHPSLVPPSVFSPCIPPPHPPAAQYANDREYVEYILRLIAMAGDFVAEGVWHKAVRVVTNSEEHIR